ncbi:winged helix DNA-binding domain-containing protein [Vibrio makurazakiensis]|uniref:winged helix-turn-helix domain-containing protein n=1 Tax=Vibrio makurazakiensis TaxID=2910250 RepID=UPI003D12CC50
MESLSLAQAKKLVLHSQQLPPKRLHKDPLKSTLNAIEHLGYIQLDTISVIQRAHHHTLWSRNPAYQVSHLDQLIENKDIFEYWSHAAAYLPMRDYRFSLHRKEGFRTGRISHWYKRDQQLIDHVSDRIENEGPLMAKDFEGDRPNPGGWGGKPAKQALETLFMQGDLMVSKRVNFHKVYDLTERVIPASIDTSLPTDEEYAQYLITRYLTANGLGNATEMSYLLKKTKPLVENVLKAMLESGQITVLTVPSQMKGQVIRYYALPESLSLLDRPLARSQLKILSPFDNLLIQRKRMQSLFGFDYLLECYVPEAKRQFGYFSLPILWRGELVARMDCKVIRKQSLLVVHNLALESKVKDLEGFVEALRQELTPFMAFNQCNEFRIECSTPKYLVSLLA